MLLALLIVLMLTLPVSPAFAADPPSEAVSAHLFGTDAPFAGRLYVESIGVDVALYRTLSQETVDRVDSAAYFDLDGARGHMIIADHCTQAFRDLAKSRLAPRHASSRRMAAPLTTSAQRSSRATTPVAASQTGRATASSVSPIC